MGLGVLVLIFIALGTMVVGSIFAVVVGAIVVVFFTVVGNKVVFTGLTVVVTGISGGASVRKGINNPNFFGFFVLGVGTGAWVGGAGVTLGFVVPG